MKTYTIQRTAGEPDWTAIPAAAIDQPHHDDLRLEDTPVRAWAQLAWNDEAIFVHEWAVEPKIRAEHRGLTDSVCQDSCLEVFLCPMEGDERYFNIEYNPNAARYLGLGTSKDDLIRLLPEGNNDGFDPKVNRTADGWEIFYRVPFRFIRRVFPDFEPKPGKTMRANFCKCGDLTEQPHWLTWQHIGRPLSFHAPHKFGRLVFG